MSEKVDHPAHYGGGDNPHEHVKCAEAWGLVDTPRIGAWLYNATKYICRVGKKQGADPLEDLRKAQWYLNRAIERLREDNRLVESVATVTAAPPIVPTVTRPIAPPRRMPDDLSRSVREPHIFDPREGK